MSAITDSSGKATFGGLPYGAQYTVTPQASSDLTFVPPALQYTGTFDQDGAFLVIPHADPVEVKITGDEASGVPAQSELFMMSTARADGFSAPEPYPSIVIYDTEANETFHGSTWSLRPGLTNGDIGLKSAPQEKTYTETDADVRDFSMICWQGTTGEWVGQTFSLTFDTVTATPTDQPAVFYYVVHGSLHMDCPAASPGTAGKVAMDLTF